MTSTVLHVLLLCVGTWVTLGILAMHHDPLVWDNTEVSTCNVYISYCTMNNDYDSYSYMRYN